MTGRRKGTPCACEGGSGCGDSCGNKIRKINGISPDPAGAFEIEAGDGIQIEDIENGIRLSTVIDPSIFVTLATVQEITAKKTFKSELIADNEHSIGGNMTANIDIVMQNEQGVVPTDHAHFGSLRFLDKTGYPDAAINYSISTSGSKFFSMGWFGDGLGTIDIGRSTATGDIYARAPWRPYNPTNSRDIVTIGMLNTDISIAGAKTIENNVTVQGVTAQIKSTNIATEDAPTSNLGGTRLQFVPNNALIGDYSKYIAQLVPFHEINATELTTYVKRIDGGTTHTANMGLSVKSDGTKYLHAPSRAYNSANVDDVVTIGSLASNPNVVHMTGNEDIAGQKIFTNVANGFKVPIATRDTVNSGTSKRNDVTFYAENGDILGRFSFYIGTNNTRTMYLQIWNPTTQALVDIPLGSVTP